MSFASDDGPEWWLEARIGLSSDPEDTIRVAPTTGAVFLNVEQTTKRGAQRIARLLGNVPVCIGLVNRARRK